LNEGLLLPIKLLQWVVWFLANFVGQVADVQDALVKNAMNEKKCG